MARVYPDRPGGLLIDTQLFHRGRISGGPGHNRWRARATPLAPTEVVELWVAVEATFKDRSQPSAGISQ